MKTCGNHTPLPPIYRFKASTKLPLKNTYSLISLSVLCAPHQSIKIKLLIVIQLIFLKAHLKHSYYFI
ncbi:hypothetical protein S4054249_12485 [Pseudoalteromonas luteoviolacea]|nr:hypothetical protein S4054249_12485 [Pseudoalteromonas luteoviolacea]AOT13535.1 hypothetical protein S40542_12460 [Pseudoalteromonas luteoviolacea]AOT18448.1 hypothetical protein S4054_12460 [Pseudoalteromonas luteoviolacea]KZN72093.1 hypothetical protein N481_16915 [Pseudoalteromonas luteoviolacea S4047-1]